MPFYLPPMARLREPLNPIWIRSYGATITTVGKLLSAGCQVIRVELEGKRRGEREEIGLTNTLLYRLL